jgi:hypothetical protein
VLPCTAGKAPLQASLVATCKPTVT